MQILNKTANMRNDVCYRVTSGGKITEVNKGFVESVIGSFEELRKDEKSISNVDDLVNANMRTRQRHLVRVRKLEEQQKMQRNAGYAMVSSVTMVGILIMGILIFMLVKLVLFG